MRIHWVLFLLIANALAGCSRTAPPDAMDRKASPQQLYQLGLKALADSDYNHALDFLQKAVEKDPSFQEATVALAEAAELANQPGLAVRALADSLLLFPRQVPPPYTIAELHLRLGRLYAKLEQPLSAEEHYRDATKENADLSEGWLELGMLQLRQSRFEEGRRNLLESVRARPIQSQAYLALAQAEQGLENSNGVEYWLRKAVLYAPTEQKPRLALARFFLDHQRPAEAVEWLGTRASSLEAEEKAVYLQALEALSLNKLAQSLQGVHQ